eukprot:TRINITY_DN2622_c0_g1_i1.p1 TRINITY_DN2622_c0_g1~~TRINITY_DN2622_c0_g1_i1.p1  ORF type:complete len:220 (-),score=8.74 TRINITY_DN2622_c0_g1_i1:101-760(-)
MAYWSPYDNNGGTSMAVAGPDFAIVAADTRMATGYSIYTRDASKIFRISDRCVLVSSGFQADRRMLQKVLNSRHEVYQQQHNEEMSCEAMAQLLANTLYYKRFFPYYTFNALAGLDVNGVGCVYGYDAVGSHERLGYAVHGTGQRLVVPVLDNQLHAANPLVMPPQPLSIKLSQDEAVELIKDTFASAAERDIYTGDAVEIVVIDSNGLRREVMELRKD